VSACLGEYNNSKKSLHLYNDRKTCSVTITPTGGGYQGGYQGNIVTDIKIDDFCYKNIALKKLLAQLVYTATDLSGTIQVIDLHKNEFHGKASWNFAQEKGDLFVQNETPLSLPQHPAQTIPAKALHLKGRLYKTKNELISFSSSLNTHFIKMFLPAPLQKWLTTIGGAIETTITVKNTNKIEGSVSFSGGKIKIHGNYNLITQGSATFALDLDTHQLVIRDIKIMLQKGSLVSDQIIVRWNNQGEITFIHGSGQAHNLFINWKNDFYAFINSNMFIKQVKESPLMISGDIIIKKSLFNESLFSRQRGSNPFIQSMLPFTSENRPISLDLHISNEDDIFIKTPFLRAKAKIDLRVTRQQAKHGGMSISGMAVPRLTGSIKLNRGTLTFPKHKLYISSGKLDFIPTHINNPMITLFAKNRIKKYLIGLHVSGPLQSPTIFLESNPELTEEQIIALLFAGSERITLQAGLPTIIMQNLHTLILGNKTTLPPAQKFFKTLAKPLKYIQIRPNFTDQSGRGGVTGTISIDINKQFHAQIQKNFTMQDDFSFQLDYFLSDNFNLKAIHDYRGDLGAELELSCKP